MLKQLMTLVMMIRLSSSFISGRRSVHPYSVLKRSHGNLQTHVNTEIEENELDRKYKSSLGESVFAYNSQNHLIAASGDLSLTFLGTGSCSPTPSRGASCISLRHGSDVWLFDCGENTQGQIQKSDVRSSRIKKIFITHMHGDHIFGLGALMCQMGSSQRSRKSPMDIIDIYGPEGLRDYMRAVIQLSYSKVVSPHRVHELKGLKDMRGGFPLTLGSSTSSFSSQNMLEGRDIFPDGEGKYTVVDDEGCDLQVLAAPMQHTVPGVGYVIIEKEKPGRLKIENVEDIVLKNKDGLNKRYDGYFGRVYKSLKMLTQGERYTFPDGTAVEAGSDITGPPIKGRKIVIMGDTRSGKHIQDIAKDPDVLVHEATNAWLGHDEEDRDTTPLSLERATFWKGHSTPQMAARFAKATCARQLILTHFSSRYKGDASPESLGVMEEIAALAEDEAGFERSSGRVITAFDFMRINIPPHKENKEK